MHPFRYTKCKSFGMQDARNTLCKLQKPPHLPCYLMVVMMRQFFIGVNNLRDQARAALVGEERELIFG